MNAHHTHSMYYLRHRRLCEQAFAPPASNFPVKHVSEQTRINGLIDDFKQPEGVPKEGQYPPQRQRISLDAKRKEE